MCQCVNQAGQHTYHWIETRLAMALSGVRKRLASVYKFFPRYCTYQSEDSYITVLFFVFFEMVSLFGFTAGPNYMLNYSHRSAL